MTDAWCKYVPNESVSEFSSKGWEIVETAPCHHDAYSTMMEWKGGGDPPHKAGDIVTIRARVMETYPKLGLMTIRADSWASGVPAVTVSADDIAPPQCTCGFARRGG